MSPRAAAGRGARLLQRLAIDRPAARAWALYDWANSAFVTTVVAAVFPIYFSTVAAADLPPASATARFALTTTAALVIIAALAPLLGALADYAGLKKRLLAVFLALGVLATAGMVFIQRGDWLLAACLFALGNIGAWGTFVFYDSLLPHVAVDETDMDRLSTTGYAAGYLGGGLLLAVHLAWIARPAWFGIADSAAAARWSFLSVAVWWLVFSLPLFRRVSEPRASAPAAAPMNMELLRCAGRRLLHTARAVRRYRQAWIFLLAFLLYNDGIGTIIRMATIYGTELGLPPTAMIGAILLVQFVGVPCAVLFARLAQALGIKRAIVLALLVYTGVSVLGYSMTTVWHFYLLAALVGSVQGGSQALSRSLFARLIPRTHSAEFFAFFSICEKLSGVFGPALFAAVIAVTGSSRNAILSVIGLFVSGGLLVLAADVARGQQAVRDAESDAPI